MGIINTQLISATALTAGSNVPVGVILHNNSVNLSAAGSTWKIEGAGYYKITANLTIEPTAVANMIVTLNDNGATIAQVASSPAAAGDPVNVTLIGVVYNKCCCAEDLITLSINSAGTVTEADVVIERI